MMRYGNPLALLLWSGTAFAAFDKTDVLQPFVQESLLFDDNVFRVSGDNEPREQEMISLLSGGARVNGEFGRQKLLLDLNVTDNRYLNNGFLDHVSTADKAVWLWELGRLFSGELGYGYSRYLGSFNFIQTPLKDLVTEHNAFFNLDYALHPRWTLGAGAVWLDGSHSAEDRKSLDIESYGTRLGLTYTTPQDNRVGIDWKYADATFPVLQPLGDSLVNNDYRENTFGLNVNWTLTAKTNIEGRFGYVIREYREYSDRDYDGDTWRIILNWKATEKTSLALTGWKELVFFQDLASNYILSEGVGLSSNWKITEKLTVVARLDYENRGYEGTPEVALDGADRRNDEVLSGQLGLVYKPVNWVEAKLNYRGQDRTSNRPDADYQANTVTGTLTITF